MKSTLKLNQLKKIEFNAELKWWQNRVENECAWKVSIEDIKENNYNLNFKKSKC
ncbi:N-6 DNA methylase [Lysinibacillus boronitolerans]|uniref:N-6 DNA methylase n=1 Tax=Lysinibacillus boronitolerans TaxID=309788 RepID=UPI000FFCA8D6